MKEATIPHILYYINVGIIIVHLIERQTLDSKSFFNLLSAPIDRIVGDYSHMETVSGA
jgi:hypothetical protein